MEKNFSEITKKIKNLKIQGNIIVQNIKKQTEIAQEKKSKEIDLNEKEIIAKKDRELLSKKLKEKTIEERRKREADLQMAKFKQYINNSIGKGRNQDYLYKKLEISFEKKEEEYIHKILKKRENEEKEISKELNKKDFIFKKKIESSNNSKNLQKIWKERSDLLPKYVSPIYKEVLYSEENIKENKKNIIENKKKYFILRKKYGKEKVHLPQISNILKRTNENKGVNEKSIQNKSFKTLNKDLLNIKLIQVHKRNSDYTIKNNNNNFNIEKEKKLTKSHSCITLNNNKLIIPDENINNKISKKNPGEYNYLDELKINKIKNKSNENNNLITGKDLNVEMIKGKIEVMEDKYKRGKELLKIKGGYIQNKELGDKVNNILIESIKNKLDIIENIYQ